MNMVELNPPFVLKGHSPHLLRWGCGRIARRLPDIKPGGGGCGALTNSVHINDLLLAAVQRSVGRCETKRAAAEQESQRVQDARGDDLRRAFSATGPNEAWFANVIPLLLLAVMRVRLLGYPALIILIRNQERENVERSFLFFFSPPPFLFRCSRLCAAVV